MIWSTFLITTVTLTVTLADLSLSNNGKTPASAGVLTIVYGGEREPHRLLSAPLALSANVFTSLPRSQFTVNTSKVSTILTPCFKGLAVFRDFIAHTPRRWPTPIYGYI